MTTTSSVNQSDSYAVDNIIMRCVDDGPSDNRADSISSHHQVIGRRRCRTVTITSTTTTTTTTTTNGKLMFRGFICETPFSVIYVEPCYLAKFNSNKEFAGFCLYRVIFLSIVHTSVH